MPSLRAPGACLTFVLIALLCFTSVESKSKHYAVRVRNPADLQKVADILTQQGLIVKRINRRFSFISVRTADDARAAASATPAASAAGYPAAPCTDPMGCPTGQQPTFPGPPVSQDLDNNLAVAAASDPTIASAYAALPAGVEIEVDPQAYLLGRRLPSRSLLQDEIADVVPAADTCSALPDSSLVGRFQEDAPYGIKMVQGTDDTVIQISKDFRKKVMYCVIDTGLDRTHWEFNKEDTTGCTPNTKRATGTTHNCKYDWGVDYMRHGTHTAGTIGATRNGKGIVGVSAGGAQIYAYNAFGPEETFSLSLVVDAWEDCIAELDARKAATGQPDMKMIISMSIGSDGDVRVVREAIKQLAAERAQDVLFVGAAGNGAAQGAVYSYPASYPECVSVAAIDWARDRAYFSQVNNEVDWAAPGVQTLSTIPVRDEASATYNTQPTLSVSASNAGDVFTKPGPKVLTGSKAGLVTAGVSDCGTGAATCTGATGKICLLERGGNMFCEKVFNCIQGGGVGAIIYGKADQPACETFEGVLDYAGCPSPANGWPVSVTLTRGQGAALKTLIARTPSTTITLDTREAADPLPFDFMSGTSMATPTASGVAGTVWSAHTDCSAAEIRAAIAWTALDIGRNGYDREFGFGLVQAAAAHQYLLEHPCSGNTSAAEPPKPGRRTSEAALRTLAITSPATAANAASVGKKVKFTITAAKTRDAQRIAQIPIRLTPSQHLSCESLKLTTDDNGVAIANCSLRRAGEATLTAAIGAGERTVTAVSKVTVARRASP